MSIRKTKSNDISYSYRQEIFRSLKKRKIETIGIIITLLLVGFDFLAYTRSLYSIFMLVGVTIYVIYYFLQSVILYTRLRLSLKVLEENPDFKAFKETLEKLTPEELKQFQDIQKAEVEKAKSEGHNIQSITEE
jgi:hypothetical protein